MDSVIHRPQLGIEKSLKTITVEPGKKAEFELVVTNLSEVTAYTITIEDRFPAGFIYLEDSVRSSDTVAVELDDKHPLVWVLEDLEPHQSIRFTYKIMLDNRLEEGIYTTTAKVYAMDRSGFQFETNEFALDVKVERAVSLNITQRIPEQEKKKELQAGKPMTVITTIENTGSAGLIDGIIVVTLPEGIAYVLESSRINEEVIGDPIRDGQTLQWKLGRLPAGVQKTLRYMLYIRGGVSGTHQVITEIQGTSDTGKTYQSKKHTIDVTLAP